MEESNRLSVRQAQDLTRYSTVQHFVVEIHSGLGSKTESRCGSLYSPPRLCGVETFFYRSRPLRNCKKKEIKKKEDTVGALFEFFELGCVTQLKEPKHSFSGSTHNKNIHDWTMILEAFPFNKF